MQTLEIHATRLWESLQTMAQIGSTPRGGVTRLALSDEDWQARDLFCQWLRDAGLEVKVDDLGNIFGWRPGLNPSLPPVLLGSHLDTVPHGGKFDGALGTLAALEVVRSLNDAGIQTRRSVGVVAFTAEEGSRFEPSILGPSAISGRFPVEYVYARRDVHSSATFGDELQRIGYKGEAGNRPPVPAAFLELHIEQGPLLDQERLQIGVVEAIVGVQWIELCLEGEANHAGTTPMAGRRDALVGAARIIHAVRDMARTLGGTALATIGRLKLEPDTINVIPGRVTIGVDIRHADAAWLDHYTGMIKRLGEWVAQEEKLEVSAEHVQLLPVTRFPSSLVEIVEAAVRERTLSYKRMMSGAGHDSQWMARFCPTAMIFVPSRLGRSHCEEEETSPEEVANGAGVLATAALRLASE